MLQWAGSQLWVVLLTTSAKLGAGAWVRKSEGELRLKKDVGVSTIWLALGLAEEVGEQKNKSESLPCCFAKFRRAHKAPD